MRGENRRRSNLAGQNPLHHFPSRPLPVLQSAFHFGEKFVPELASVVASTLASYYEEVEAKVHEWTAPLSDDQFWRNPYDYGNSIGHLLLHLTGNLNYYIGAKIANTGYVRDRDREFNDTVKKPKQQVLADFDRAI